MKQIYWYKWNNSKIEPVLTYNETPYLTGKLCFLNIIIGSILLLIGIVCQIISFWLLLKLFRIV